MITAEINGAVFNDTALLSFMGLSTDEKPSGKYKDMFIKNGSTFFEMDTQNVKFYNGTTNSWV